MSADDDDDRTSRGDRKRARRVREDALSELAKDLTAQSSKTLARLELPDDLAQAHGCVLVAQHVLEVELGGAHEVDERP